MAMDDFINELNSDDELTSLKALRRHLSAHIAVAETHEVAQLSNKLQAVLKRISEIDKTEQKGQPSDEIAKRREARRSAAKMVKTAGGPGVKRRTRGT